MIKNKTLSAAKSAKNDEFYMQYADIQKEIIAYPDYCTDTFGYNERGEVVFSRGDAEAAEYSYDDIGNLKVLSSAITNLYIANALNQYTSIQSSSTLSASPRDINPQYDIDGNLLTDGSIYMLLIG